MAPIICANATGGGPQVHSTRHLDNLTEMGFTHVCGYEFGINRDTEHWIKNIHAHGMKFITRWPDWSKLDCLTDECAFRNYQRALSNSHASRTAGPSHWNEKATALAEQSIQEYADIGVDGVAIQVLMCDRPFPTDWYRGNPAEDWRKITSFWSFDPAAARSWSESAEGMMMPPRAINDGRPPDPNMARFYQWYQQAWLRKLERLSYAALGAGLEDIWTWYVPLNEWNEENMADGTADSLLQIEGWRRKMLAAGAHPVVLTTCIIHILAHYVPDAVKTMHMANNMLEWESICGVRTSHSAESCLQALEVLGGRQIEIGYSGLYVTDRFIREKEVSEVRPLVQGLVSQIKEAHPLGPTSPGKVGVK